MALSDETKDRINAAIGVGKNIVTYGWIPFVIYVGYTRSNPQPNLINFGEAGLQWNWYVNSFVSVAY
ncbi:hypothetical protein QFC21_004750 [Naganishia friedmannii]|uniref:Uncharacterized protein n=1 Tax=Naganishia friedmannii TaxID=89922 RepID=A0ACC2VGL5_9TREE|nr:hypothetical protein QFC21_004750 [Naganishia friedmannii]